MERKTRVWRRIEALCGKCHFSPTVVYWKSERILSYYRDIRNLPTVMTHDAQMIKDKTTELIREKFHKVYVEKKCSLTGSLDYILSDILSLEYADDVIEVVFERMNDMSFCTEEYRPIIEYNFLYPDELPDDDIQIEVGMSRTSYYRKKKEAIILFGILLWNVMLERSALAIH